MQNALVSFILVFSHLKLGTVVVRILLGASGREATEAMESARETGAAEVEGQGEDKGTCGQEDG